MSSLKLCDLDETVWERLPAEAIAELAQVIVDRISSHHVRKVFQHRHFPRPPEGTDLSSLNLENRTRRCLMREGFDERPQTLGDHTIGEIMSMRAFGPRCLVDLLSALESLRQEAAGRLPDGRRSGVRGDRGGVDRGGGAAGRLARRPGRAERRPAFRPRDVRPGRRGADRPGPARRVLSRTQDPPDPVYFARQVEELADRIERMSELTIEAELIEVFAPDPRDRNAEILIEYYGWGDGRQHTLTEVGDRFGVTRERIRQICAKLTHKPKNLSAVLAPAMDRALALVEERLPCAAGEIEAELRRRGWTAVGMPLENLATAAKLLGRAADFRVVKIDLDRKGSPRLAVRAGQVEATPMIADAAKKDVYFHGLATIERIQRLAAAKFAGGVSGELVEQTLRLVEGFSWLDEKSGWFRIRGDRQARAAEDDRQGVGGGRRGDRGAASRGPGPQPPLVEGAAAGRRLAGVLPRLARRADRGQADRRRSAAQLADFAHGVEWELVNVLRARPGDGGGDMEDICVREGMNRFSFHAFVSWSPVIVQLGHSVYGLVGGEVSASQIDDLLAVRRAKARPPRVGQPRLDGQRQGVAELSAVEGGEHLRGDYRAGGVEEGGSRPLRLAHSRRRPDRGVGHEGRPRLGPGAFLRQHGADRRPHPLDPRPDRTDGDSLLGREGWGRDCEMKNANCKLQNENCKMKNSAVAAGGVRFAFCKLHSSFCIPVLNRPSSP